MHDIASLTFRLESYLLQLTDINQRWTQWLTDTELTIAKSDSQQLTEVSATSEALMAELRELLDGRARLLADANATGLEVSDIATLAQRLPAWNKAGLRESVRYARSQVNNLRRLHAATWVMLSQMLHHYGDMMKILMLGHAKTDVYLKDARTEMGGGQLLDASL